MRKGLRGKKRTGSASVFRVPGFLPYGRKRSRRRNGVRIDSQLDDGGLARLAGALECGSESLGPLDDLAMRAEGARVGGEIRVLQVGAEDPSRIFALLVHADRAAHARAD